jgi:hypothetical protein
LIGVGTDYRGFTRRSPISARIVLAPRDDAMRCDAGEQYLPERVYFRAAGDALSSEWDMALDTIDLSINPGMVGLPHEPANLEGLLSTQLRADI